VDGGSPAGSSFHAGDGEDGARPRRVSTFRSWPTTSESAFSLILLGVLLFLLLGGIPLFVGVAAVLVALVGLVTRVVFGRPWLVEARSTRGELAWRVRGTRDSKRAVRLIARAIEVGDRDYSPPRSPPVPSDYSVSNPS